MVIKIERLMTIPNVTEEIAKEVLAVIHNEKDVEEFKSVQDWLRQCFNRPSLNELKMCAINELIEGCGTEASFSDGSVWPDYEYVNVGDPYIPTVILQRNGTKYGGAFYVACWGDIEEEMERNREDSLDEESE